MATVYEIDPMTGTVSRISRVVEETKDAETFLASLSQGESVTLGMLPKDIISYRKVGTLELYVIYQEASVEKYGVRAPDESSTYFDYDDIEILTPARLHVYGTLNGRLEKEMCRWMFTTAKNRESVASAQVCRMWFPNTYERLGVICGGHDFDRTLASDSVSAITKMNFATDMITSSTFNNDLQYFVDCIRPSVWDLIVNNSAPWVGAKYEGSPAWDRYPKRSKADSTLLQIHMSFVKGMHYWTKDLLDTGTLARAKAAIHQVNDRIAADCNTTKYLSELLDNLISYYGG